MPLPGEELGGDWPLGLRSTPGPAVTVASLFVSYRLATRRRPCECGGGTEPCREALSTAMGARSTAARALLGAWAALAEAVARPGLTHLWLLALAISDLIHLCLDGPWNSLFSLF